MLINIKELPIKKQIHGIIHVGAHECEERTNYLNFVSDNQIVWIDALKEKVQNIKNRNPTIKIYNECISNKDNENVEFKITNNYQSSSFLNLKEHLVQHPDIYEIDRINLKTKTLKTFYNENNFEYSQFNFINLDIQGAELMALKGTGAILNFIDYVYIEVNVIEVYEGCALLQEIDDYLLKFNLVRVKTCMTTHGWGDAFYIKRPDNLKYIRYGTKDVFIDITDKVQDMYIPSGDETRASIFGDPVYGTVKSIYVYMNEKEYIINHHKCLYIKNNEVIIQNELEYCFNNGDPLTNGELFFYNSIKSSITVIFDIGSRNDSLFLDFDNQVHYFEPVLSSLTDLSRQKNKNKRSYFNNFGLSDKSEVANYYPRYESFYNRITSCKVDDSENRISLNLQRADEYILKNNIDVIDFIKIDTEGYELNVLKGFGKYLNKVNIIQFEYGGTFLDNNTKLIDIINLLKQYGFSTFYYLYNNGLCELNEYYDHYRYCNIVTFKLPLFKSIHPEHLTVYKPNYNKIRLGKEYDGGYILCDIPNVKYSIFLSGGILDDISFEEDFCNKYTDIKCYAYDGSIDSINIKNKNITFVKKYISDTNSEYCTNLHNIINNNNDIFIKMDIEGGEIPWINSLSLEQINKFSQIVIEFHNPFGEKELDVFNKLSNLHVLVHFHPNNACGSRTHKGVNIPNVFECTYIHKKYYPLPYILNNELIPSSLDNPNVLENDEIYIDYPPFVN
uniref:Methyltransferase FkbM domain-containing protein n=1 Tax=viral metagenome TaxID=1070528 RepID=A0A6C0AZX4_9ZZZZ